jgi:predicted ester cyclase
MSSEELIHLAKRWFVDLWSIPDYDMADEIIATDYDPDWIHIDKKGPEQVKHEIRYIRSIFPDLKYEIVDSATADDRIWVRYKASGTQQGNAWGFESTSKKVEFEGVTILFVNSDGMIVDRWGAFCFYDILVDLELAPPLWELNSHLKGN